MKTQDAQVYEILEELDSCTTKQRKVDLINTKYNNHTPLQYVLRWNFDRSIKSLLPEGEPPYTKDDAPHGHEYQILHKGYRMFQYFFKGGKGSMLQPMKRETMFVNLLETLHAEEAELLVLAKDRKLKYKGITKKLIQDALPGLIQK